MKDVTSVCAALKAFRFEAGPNGVLWVAPSAHGYKMRNDRRIQPIGGIGRPGEWRLVELPSGRALSDVLKTKADLHRALLWQLALDDNGGLLPPTRIGHSIFARRHRTRFTRSYIFVYRKD